MRKMNRFIPVALACAIFAAQPVQAATIIRDSDKQATSQNKQTTNTTQNPQAGNEGGPGYEDSKPNTSNNTTNTTGQSQVSAEAKAAADAIAKPTISAEAGILYDVTNGRVLFEKNADEKLAPASTTKLMTALLVLEKSKSGRQGDILKDSSHKPGVRSCEDRTRGGRPGLREGQPLCPAF